MEEQRRFNAIHMASDRLWKKVKFCHIFRDKLLVEKMADFRGNLWEFSWQKMKEQKKSLLVVFTWQISCELKKSSLSRNI